jgi:hypothetical protein
MGITEYNDIRAYCNILLVQCVIILTPPFIFLYLTANTGKYFVYNYSALIAALPQCNSI